MTSNKTSTGVSSRIGNVFVGILILTLAPLPIAAWAVATILARAAW